MDVNLRENLDSFLTLAEASKLTGYHQDYLGFLCRTGKLNGFKIGRNWTTTKQALDEFVKNYKNGITEVTDETGTRIPVKVEHQIMPTPVILSPVANLYPENDNAALPGISTTPLNPDLLLPILPNPGVELNSLRKDVFEEIDRKVKNLSDSVNKIHAETEEQSKILQQNKLLATDFEKSKSEQDKVLLAPFVQQDNNGGQELRLPLHKRFASNFNLSETPDEESTSALKPDSKQVLSNGVNVEKLYSSFVKKDKINFTKIAGYALAAFVLAVLFGSVFWADLFDRMSGRQLRETRIVYQNNRGGGEQQPVQIFDGPVTINKTINQLLGFSNADLYKLIDNRLNQYLDEGRFKGDKGDTGLLGPAGAPGGAGGGVTYLQPNPANGFPGGSLVGFTFLSSENFVTSNAIVNNSFTSNGGAVFNGATVFNGPTTLNGTTTINNLSVSSINPGFTPGSVVFQGVSGLSQDSANFFYTASTSQLSLGTTTPNPSALLELDSTSKGFLAPRMTTAQINAIASPAVGLLVYNTDTNLFNAYNGTIWLPVSGVWSNILAPTGNLALNMESFTSTFTYGSSTGSSNLFNLTDAEGNTGTGTLFTLATALGSSLSPFSVTASGTLSLIVNPVGNVGIGTSTPTQKLSVAGNMQLTGAFFDASNASGTAGQILISTGDGTAWTPTSTLASSLGAFVQGGNVFGATGTLGTLDNFGLNFITNSTTRMTILANGNVGIGTSSPANALSVSGDVLFTGNAEVGGNLNVAGGSTVFGNSTTTGLVVTGGVGSSLIPTINKTYDLGSPAFFWRNVYVGNLIAENISAASSSIGGTASNDFIINSDNVSADAEDMHLIFDRGTVVPNAVIGWDSILKHFNINKPVYIQNQSGSSTNPTFTAQAAVLQTGDVVEILNSTGGNMFNISPFGNVSIATLTPGSILFAGSGGLINQNNANFFWDNDAGRLGLGTSTPAQTLSVAGNMRLTGALFDASNASGTAGQILTSTGTGTAWTSTSTLATSLGAFIQGGNSFGATGTLGTLDNFALNFITNSLARMTILPNGNVGVGTTNPAGAFEVAGQCVTGDTKLKRRRRKKKKTSGISGGGDGDGAKEISNFKFQISNADQGQPINGHATAGTSDDYEYDEVRIDQVTPGDEILSMEKDGAFTWSRINKLQDMGRQETYKLITRSGKTIRTTGNHPYFALQKRPASQLQKLYAAFEVDQSNRLEDMSVDSVVALASQQVGQVVTVKISKKLKLKIFKRHYGGRPKSFGPEMLATIILYAIWNLGLKIGSLVIDQEYPGYENEISAFIRRTYPEIVVSFRSIGRQVMAHKAAWARATNRKTPQRSVLLETMASLDFNESLTVELLHSGLVTGDSQPTRSLIDLLYHSPLMLSRGEMSQAEWIEARRLRPGMLVATVDGWEAITAIYKTGITEQTYDIEIENTHNFVGNGIVAHNTAIFDGRVSIGTSTPVSGVNLFVQGQGGNSVFTVASSSGSTLLTVTPNGNVGIGTASPVNKLDVAGNVGVGSNQVKFGTPGSEAVSLVVDSGNANTLRVSNGVSTSALGNIVANSYYTGQFNSDTVLNQFNLTLGFTTGVVWRSGAGGVVNTGLSRLSSGVIGVGNGISGNATGTLIAGNVGIGTTTPAQTLSVAGNMRLTGAFFDANNASGTSGQILTSTGIGTAWSSTSTLATSLGAFIQGGNTFGATGTLGTLDNFGLNFITNSTTKMTILPNGNVGIGTTNPGTFNKLDIQGAESIGNGVAISVRNTDTGASSYALYKLNVGAGNDGGMFFASNALGVKDPFGIVNGITFRAGLNTQDIGFSVGNTVSGTGNGPSLIIKSSGNVGIGTTTPAQKLAVAGNMRLTGAFFDANNASGTAGQILTSTGTSTIWSSTSTVATSLGAFIQGGNTFGATGTLGTLDNFGLNFITNSTTRMTILANGNVGIGTAAPLSLLDVAGTAQLRGSASTIGLAVNSSGNVGIGNNTPGDTLDITGSFTVAADIGLEGTGGTITHAGGFTIHTFTSGGTFSIPGLVTAQVLVIGGGGGAGSGAGGGGGGYQFDASHLIPSGSYSVTVGAGGTNANGSNSVFDTITSTGGGKGGGNGGNGSSGGSGGGGGFSGGSTTTGGTGTQGGNGGGNGGILASPFPAGGGGGAGGNGATPTSSTIAGSGGVGTSNSISGVAVTYAGGGGGGVFNGGTGGAGGAGGGGAGANTTGTGTNGAANTGGGAGGGGSGSGSTTGGSGIVIIKYLTNAVSPVHIKRLFVENNTGNVGINSSSPGGLLSLQGYSGSATDLLSIASSSGQSLFVVKSSGNVGIGTTSPAQKLVVAGNMQLTGAFFDANNASGTAGQILTSTGTGTAWSSTSSIATSLGAFIQGGNSFGATGTLGTLDNFGLNFITNSTTRMTILATGNVGIGTTSPTYSLTVAPSGGTALQTVFVQDATPVTGQTKLVLKNGAGNVSADHVLELQNTSGTAIAWFDASGSVRAVNNISLTTSFVGMANLGGTTGAFLAGSNSLLGFTASTGAFTGSADTGLSRGGVGVLLVGNGTAGSATGTLIAGNIGIGTSTPSQKLTVAGNMQLTGALFDASNASGTAGQILTSTGIGTAWSSTSTLATSLGAFIQGGNSFGTTAILGTNDNQDLQFETNSTTRMTILANGNVGIGTTSPVATLHIANGAAGGTGLIIQRGSGNAANDAAILLRSVAGTDILKFDMSGNLNVSSVGDNIAASYLLSSSAFQLGSNYPIAWSSTTVYNGTKDIGLSRGAAGKLYVGNGTAGDFTGTLIAGNVGIGTTSPSQKLVVAGNMQLTGTLFDSTNASGTLGMVLQTTGTGTRWVATSTLGIATSASGTPGNIQFAGVNGAFNASNLFTFDNILNRLAIGTTSTSSTLTLQGTAGTAPLLTISSSTGANLFTVLANGNVGIGVSVPTAKLSIQGTSTINLMTIANTAGSQIWSMDQNGSLLTTLAPTVIWNLAGNNQTVLGSGTLGLGSVNGGGPSLTVFGNITQDGNNVRSMLACNSGGCSMGGANGSLGTGAATLNVIGFSNTALDIFTIQNTVRNTLFSVKGNGLVGIGSTTPTALLTIKATSTLATTDLFNIASSSNTILFVVKPSGNVGIGTSTPAQKLVIQGTAGANDILNVASSSGVSALYVASSGNVGIGTAAPSAMLHIGSAASGGNVRIANGWLCVDTDDTCTGATTAGTVYAVNAYTTGADVAENYPTLDSTLVAGEIVAADNTKPVHVSRAVSSRAILGIISTRPGILLNGYKAGEFANASTVPVALSGRVPVKVSNENGPIELGDFLTLSRTLPGYGVKALYSTNVVGQALENFDGASTSTSTILAFVQIGFRSINNTFILGENDGQLASATSTRAISQMASSSLASVFLINQQGSGNLLQLQSGGQNRLLIANNGSFNLFASTTVATSTILSVSNGTTTQFSITAAGHITVGKDSAGTAVIKAGDNQAVVEFDVAYETTPKIVITAQTLPNFYYGVATKTPDNFTIQMSATSTQDVSFDWIALAQSENTKSVSSQNLSVITSPINQIAQISPISATGSAGSPQVNLISPIVPVSTSTPNVDPQPGSGSPTGTSVLPSDPPANVTPPAATPPPTDEAPPPSPVPPADASAPPADVTPLTAVTPPAATPPAASDQAPAPITQ